MTDLSAQGTFVAMTSRARNDIDPGHVCRLFRANAVTDEESMFLVADLDAVAENFLEFLKDVANCCSRPTKLLVKSAAKPAFQNISESKADLMGQRLSACCSYCRSKVSHATSGVKLNPAVRAIGVLLVGKGTSCGGVQLGAGPLGRSLIQSSRKLQKRKSEEEAPVLRRVRSSPSSAPTSESLDELRQMYGLKPESSRPVKFASGFPPNTIVELDSDDDVQVRAEADDSESFKVLTDYACGKLYRFNVKTGGRVHANMKRGASGFQLAAFADEKKELLTEIPNLFLDVKTSVVMKRPAAALKKTPLRRLEEERLEEEQAVKQSPVEEAEDLEPTDRLWVMLWNLWDMEDHLPQPLQLWS